MKKNGFPRVFVDMDRVITDFDKGISQWFEREDIDSLYVSRGVITDTTKDQLIGTNFFQTLDKFSSTDELLKLICSFSGEYSILSAPFSGDTENSTKHKLQWVEKHLTHNPPKEVIITSEKYKYATSTVEGVEKPNLLIDDKEWQCKRFTDEGGVGIPFASSENTLEYLEEKLRKVSSL